MERRKMLEPCNKSCYLLCNTRITEQQRSKIFAEYYDLGDVNKQWEYLAKRLGTVVTNNPYKKSTRGLNLEYNLILDDGSKVRVCKTMFRNTLNIGHLKCQTALKKCVNGVLIECDQRGRRKCSNV